MQPIHLEFPKWRQWAERIKEDVQSRLVNSRQIFRGFNEVCIANSDHISRYEGQFFCRSVQRWYVSHIAMAIRSHVKTKENGISFMRLLREIHASAAQFTFEFYLQQFPRIGRAIDWQTPTFAEFSEDGKTVSAECVKRDMDELRSLSSKVETMADRSIAHLDKKGFDDTVTFGDLETCVGTFDRMVCKFLKLVCLSGYETLEPTILHDWKDIFTVPFDVRGSCR